MAIKIIQDTIIPRIAPSAGVAATSAPISLRTGYLRISIGSTTGSSGGYIAIGSNPVVTQDSFHITSYSVDIIKEMMKKQMLNTKFGKLSAMYYTDGVSISLPYSQSINTGGQTSQLRGVIYWYFLTETGDMYVLETVSYADSYKTYQSSFLKAVNSFYVFPE